MNKILFYILVILFLYFIFSRLIDNYSNVENFDPSLVPISAIVTLGKLSQKIVNGMGTLINPGNLTINKKLSVTGDTNILNSNLKFSIGNITSNDKKINTKIQSGDGLRFQKNDEGHIMDIDDNGNVDVFGSKVINGNLTVNENIIDNNANIKFGDKAMIYSGADPISDDRWVRLMNPDGTANYSEGFAANNLYSDNATIVNRILNVNGTANLSTLNVLEEATIRGTTDGFLKLKTNTWLRSTDNIARLHFGDNSHSFYGSKNGSHMFKMPNNNSVEIGSNFLSVIGNIDVKGVITANDVFVNGKSVVDNFLKIVFVSAWYGADMPMIGFRGFVDVSGIITPLITAANNNQTYTVSNFSVTNATMGGDFAHRLDGKKLELKYKCGTNPNIRTIYVGENNNLNFSCP